MIKVHSNYSSWYTSLSTWLLIIFNAILELSCFLIKSFLKFFSLKRRQIYFRVTPGWEPLVQSKRETEIYFIYWSIISSDTINDYIFLPPPSFFKIILSFTSIILHFKGMASTRVNKYFVCICVSEVSNSLAEGHLDVEKNVNMKRDAVSFRAMRREGIGYSEQRNKFVACISDEYDTTDIFYALPARNWACVIEIMSRYHVARFAKFHATCETCAPN